jgi:predicted HicB family RNase H-like nuclease
MITKIITEGGEYAVNDRTMKENHDRQVGLRFQTSMYEEMQAAAQERGLTLNSLVRQVMIRWLRKPTF